MKLASTSLQVAVERIEEHFSALSRIGNLGPARNDGFLRASWSSEETAAMEYVKRTGQEQGLSPAYDGVGNLYLTTPDQRPEVIQVGSHLDTVPKGGLYDGGAGIVAGLEALLALRARWSDLRRGLELVVWRGEESATFDSLCKGSQAAFGHNDPAILHKEFNGQTLESAILGQGFDPSFIRDKRPTLSQQHFEAIAAHIELHIEQGKKLEIDRKDIGVATSIRGTARLRVTVTGKAAHSGGTPMGASYRKDANLAIAYMQVELDRLAGQVLAEGHDLVQTVGVVNSDRHFNQREPRVYENALTKVSPFGYFTLDIRSNSRSFLESYTDKARDLIRNTGRRFRIDVNIETICFLKPVDKLAEDLQAAVATVCDNLGYTYERMPCGALHDLAVVSSQRRRNGVPIPTALVLIPCKDGISHNPEEYASPEAVCKGATVLAHLLANMAA